MSDATPSKNEPPAAPIALAAMDLDAQAKGEVQLPPTVFGLEPRADILHRMVRWQLAKRRAGTHRTLPRSEIRGTSRKFQRQKGSGNARHGNRKANLFRGGGKAHGPVLRSHAHALPKRLRRLALCHALSAKCRDKELFILEEASSKDGKTASLKAQLQKLKLTNALIIDGKSVQTEFARAAASIHNLDVLPEAGINVYDILRHKWLVLTKAGLSAVQQRLEAAS